ARLDEVPACSSAVNWTRSGEDEFSTVVGYVCYHRIAGKNLLRRQQARQRRHETTLDRSLEMTCAVSQVRTLGQQKCLRSRRGLKQERPFSLSRKDSRLNRLEFDLKNRLQIVLAQGAKHNHLVDTVDELR